MKRLSSRKDCAGCQLMKEVIIDLGLDKIRIYRYVYKNP